MARESCQVKSSQVKVCVAHVSTLPMPMSMFLLLFLFWLSPAGSTMDLHAHGRRAAASACGGGGGVRWCHAGVCVLCAHVRVFIASLVWPCVCISLVSRWPVCHIQRHTTPRTSGFVSDAPAHALPATCTNAARCRRAREHEAQHGAEQPEVRGLCSEEVRGLWRSETKMPEEARHGSQRSVSSLID